MDTGFVLTRSLAAGDRLQVFVDGKQVMFSPLLVFGPRHYLKQIAIERRQAGSVRKAVCGDGGTTVRMEVVMVNPAPDGLMEFSKCGAALRQATLVGCQVAGHDVW